MPFTYHLPLPKLGNEAGMPKVVRFKKWLIRDGARVRDGTPVALVDADGVAYEVRANGEGFLRERLVKRGDVITASAPLGTIAADGESIPYGKPYSVSHRDTKGWLRRSLKRLLRRRISDRSEKVWHQNLVARIVLLVLFFVAGLYTEARFIWWFLVAALGCGVLFAWAIRRLGD